jgi:hypothetical protein
MVNHSVRPSRNMGIETLGSRSTGSWSSCLYIFFFGLIITWIAELRVIQRGRLCLIPSSPFEADTEALSVRHFLGPACGSVDILHVI